MKTIAMRLRVTIAILGLTVPFGTFAYTIDGSLSDWGVTATGSASDWIPNAGVESKIEDQNTYYLNPGWGGQNYDAEALYLDWEGNTLYFALVTGKDPSSSHLRWGDLAFDFGNDGSYELGIETLGNGSFTTGGLYQVSNWRMASFSQSGVWDIKSGVLLDNTNLVVNYSPVYNMGQYSSSHKHYIMEGSVSLDNFSAYANQQVNVHWTMRCGNDAIDLLSQVNITPTGVPLPGTALLYVPLLAGLGFISRRRRQAGA
jgi:hypothetical protein